MSLIPVHSAGALAQEASALASRLPLLTLQAQRVAMSVAYGLHGRRKAGPGDQFWQFRQYVAGDSASQIDWRRSARSEHVILREREWQSAQTVWFWSDSAASMRFSSGKQESKADSAIILGLALADILVRGGERAGMMGGGKTSASRDIIRILCEEMMRLDADLKLPPARPLQRNAHGVWISDFLTPLPLIEARLTVLASAGAKGVLLRIFDAQEESYPFSGHVEFADASLRSRLKLGRAELSRSAYLDAYGAHMAGLQRVAAKFGWHVSAHRTDLSKASCLLGLATVLAHGAA